MNVGRKHEVSLPSSAIGVCASSIALGAVIGPIAHGRDGATWVFILLALAAGLVGLAQQTLP